MSQQGEKPAAHEDDWWRRLYEESTSDTGPSSVSDSTGSTGSTDDRFDSAAGGTDAAGDAGAAGEAEEEGGAPDPLDHPVTATPVPGPRTPPPAPLPAPVPPPPSAVPPPPAPPPAAAGLPPAPPTAAPPPVLPTAAPVLPPAGRPPAPWEAPGARGAAPGPRTFAAPPPPAPPSARSGSGADAEAGAGSGTGPPAGPRPVVGHVGDRPPTYDAEPAALPVSGADDLDGLVPDTALDGARYGTYTLRAASVRGDSARFRGEPRREALLTARFGTGDSALVLVAVACGARGTAHAHLAATDACRWIGGSVARSHARLSDDIRAGRRGDLKSGLHRLTDRTYGRLRARAADLGLEPSGYTAGLRCLLLSADPGCRTRVFFGVGAGGLFRLRNGTWQDLEPLVPATADEREETAGGDRLTMDLRITTPPSPYAGGPPPPPAEPFRFRASVAAPGDILLLCGRGLAEPMHDVPALSDELARRWTAGEPPGLPAYLADVQLRTKGYAEDRTAAAVWEA
ncbi:protein phosphatase 2C domain-containing protein [Streptomyces nitrosporeus]|uniref:protein phosphatase 2C domain-containing protein n=1 Tax=Streptomyces nitrosporeus TaxID=28894 RepID=UPI0039A08148